VRYIYSNTYHDRWVSRGEPSAWPPRSPNINPLDFSRRDTWNALCMQFLLTEKRHFALRICITIRKCPGVFDQVWQSMVKRAEACIESHGGYFEHSLLLYSLSHNSQFNISGKMLIWTFSSLCTWKPCPKLPRTI
jgi:hypothetical protein